MNSIQLGSVVIVLERGMSSLKFASSEPMAEELDEQTEVLRFVVLDFDADPHQRLRELAECVAPRSSLADESSGFELTDLFSCGLVRHQARC